MQHEDGGNIRRADVNGLLRARCFRGCCQPGSEEFIRIAYEAVVGSSSIVAESAPYSGFSRPGAIPESLLRCGGCVLEFGPGSTLPEMSIEPFQRASLNEEGE
jgi:hypothetical protein